MIGPALLLLAAQLTVGQQRPTAIRRDGPPVPDQSNYTGPKGSISGTVTDSVTGAPIRKAQVNCNGTIAVTDASGSFTFDQLPPASYFINAQQSNYPQTPMASPPTPLTLAPGEQKRGFEIKLTPGAALSGHITDDDGDPLPNCNVAVITRNRNQAMPGNAVTNKSGDYAITNLPAAKYYLEARCQAPFLQPRPFAPPDAVLPGPQLGYATRFYPGAAGFSGAQKITLASAQELRGYDFRMVAQKVSTLSIRLAGIEHTGQNRPMVSLTPEDTGPAPPPARPMDTRSGFVDPRTGLAHIYNVPPGNYKLQIFSFAGERVILARQLVAIGEESREIVVQVTPPTPLSGTLLVQGQTAEPRPTRLWVSQPDEQGMQAQAELKPDGSFTFRALAPGRYHAAIDTGGFIQTVLIGSDSFEGPDFELKPGAAGPLRIEVSSATGAISGTIDTGSAQPPPIQLVATFLGRGSTQIQITDTGQPGKYSSRLPPGHYRIYAFERTQQIAPFALLNNEAIAALGETVDIRAGSETVHNLKLITAAEIEKADQ